MQPPIKKRSQKAFVLLSAVGLLVLSGPRIAIADDIPRQLILMLIVSFLLLLVLGGKVVVGSRVHATLLAFCAFCALSALWSEVPVLTLLASCLAGISIWFGSAIGRSFGGTQALNVVFLMSCVASGISLLLGLGAPEIGLVSDGYQLGALQGIYTHRNQLAYVSCLGVVAGTIRLLFVPNRRQWTLLGLVLTACALWWSSSATGLLICLAGIGIAFASRLTLRSPLKVRGFLLVFGGLCLVPAALVLAVNRAGFYGLFGRDDTLTGRTQIWESVLQVSSRAPLLGHGWGTVWLEESSVQQEVSANVGFRLFHSHNGYLDVLIQVGLVGLVLLLISIVCVIAPAISELLRQEVPDMVVISAFVLMAVLMSYSMTEARLSNAFGLALIALFGASVVSSKILRVQKSSGLNSDPTVLAK